MSARIVFHVVETTSKDISRAESSLEAATVQWYLTSHIEMEGVVVSPPDKSDGKPETTSPEAQVTAESGVDCGAGSDGSQRETIPNSQSSPGNPRRVERL